MIHFPQIHLNLVLPFPLRCSRYILIKILCVGSISSPLTPSLGTCPTYLLLPRFYYYTVLSITLKMTNALHLYYSKLLIFFILQNYLHVLTDFGLYFVCFPESDMPFMSIIVQQDATIYSLFIFVNCSTCFEL
jgi:hypothetical protein